MHVGLWIGERPDLAASLQVIKDSMDVAPTNNAPLIGFLRSNIAQRLVGTVGAERAAIQQSLTWLNAGKEQDLVFRLLAAVDEP